MPSRDACPGRTASPPRKLMAAIGSADASISRVITSSGRPWISSTVWGRLASWKVASKNRHSRFRTGAHRGGDHRVDVRQAADLQAVEVIVAAAIDEIPDLERIVPIGGDGEIEKGILAVIVAVIGQLFPLGVEQHQRGVHLAIDAPRPAVNEDALAFLGGEDKMIDIGAAVHFPVDDDRQ